MPLAPPTACPGCPGKRYAGQPCPVCGRGKRKAHAKTTSERGYDYAWQKFRARYLAEHPLCEDCLPVVTPAVELHHKQKIKHRPDLRLDEGNVVGLCESCHQKYTKKGL